MPVAARASRRSASCASCVACLSRPGALSPARARAARARANAGRVSIGARASSSISAPASAAATTPMRACSPDISGGSLPGNPTVVAKNMEGAGGLRLANFLYKAAPKDGTDVRNHLSRHPVRAPARRQGRAVRCDQVHLHRQRQQRGERLRGLAHDRRHQVRPGADERAGRRRERAERRQLSVPEDRQRRARHQIQDHHRLSRRQRHRPRHGTRARCRAAAAGHGPA